MKLPLFIATPRSNLSIMILRGFYRKTRKRTWKPQKLTFLTDLVHISFWSQHFFFLITVPYWDDYFMGNVIPLESNMSSSQNQWTNKVLFYGATKLQQTSMDKVNGTSLVNQLPLPHHHHSPRNRRHVRDNIGSKKVSASGARTCPASLEGNLVGQWKMLKFLSGFNYNSDLAS